MSSHIQAIRGMNDILPPQTFLWQHVENCIQQVFTRYGYQEIRLPILEKTELFKRSIGEATDIVEKEMYTFLDRNDDSLTLRPEGTAGCVRAALEHGLTHNQWQKFWYSGPMFRYERPQKGRYRQFHQTGVETFGYAGPLIEAELMVMAARLWQMLGINSQLNLQINSLGTPVARASYREAFVAYCQQHYSMLDEDSKRRLTLNPLRILDSKNPAMQTLLEQAPRLDNYLEPQSKQHFEQLCNLLHSAQISFTINPRLVRGLDYYTGTVFEWVTESLGAQGAVCAGGRYDGLISQLGGQETPAVGFAIGMERLIALMELKDANNFQPVLNAYFILVGDEAERVGLSIAEQLRSIYPRLSLMVNGTSGSFKSQFKRADKSGARLALIIGENEVKEGTITCKHLRQDIPQVNFNFEDLVSYLGSYV